MLSDISYLKSSILKFILVTENLSSNQYNDCYNMFYNVVNFKICPITSLSNF